MLATILALNLSISIAAPLQRGQQTIVRDSTPADSATKNGPRRLPVTAAVLASAFRDAATRDLFNRARKARLTQDSSLKSYDSKVQQRLSVYVGIGKLGRDRLVYRQESAARVQWERNAGDAYRTTRRRVAIPVINSPKDERDALQDQLTNNNNISPVPYYPGSETLWIGDLARTEVNERELVNPLAATAPRHPTRTQRATISLPTARRPHDSTPGNDCSAAEGEGKPRRRFVVVRHRHWAHRPRRLSPGDPDADDDQRLEWRFDDRRSPTHQLSPRRVHLADGRRALVGRRRVRIVRGTVLAAAQPIG